MIIDNLKFGEKKLRNLERNMKFRKDFEICEKKKIQKIYGNQENNLQIWIRFGKNLKIWKRFGNVEKYLEIWKKFGNLKNFGNWRNFGNLGKFGNLEKVRNFGKHL